jgi:glycosyltransferase involved in cell wall biosynthesis
MALKVLHVFGAMNRGGAEMRTVSLMEKMRSHDIQFDFCVLSGEKGVLDDDIRQLGGNIYYCKLGPTFIFRFIKLLRKNKFSAVHSHVAYVSGYILLLGRIAGVKKRIAHFRNTTVSGANAKLRIARDKILIFLINHFATDILAVCNGAMVGFWGEDWHKERRCEVIYNGFEIFDRQMESGFWSNYIPNYQGQKIVINVARMDVQKNHVRQCDIFNELHKLDPSTLMVFIGKENKECKALMMNKISQYKLQENVFFLGLQSDVLPFLQHADVMLFPSEWEGLPGVVLEAASVGLPVVASNLPGVEEIADQLPFIKIVELLKSDSDWGTTLFQVLNEGINPQKMIEAFRLSDFLIDSNVRKLHAIYSQ